MIALQWMGVPTEGRILAALLLTLFLCWRFRLSFAAGAMASLIFDVTTTTSLLVILGQEIDLNIVAGTFDHHRLFAERYHRDLRPNP